MSAAPEAVLRLRGVRHHNLKNFDLDLPLGRLIVVTGLSGSGKSSLAFDTLFAEGQRRYIETFSPYARQFFDRMDKPRVDSIEGIPPAIALEQRNAVRTTRSTVGTMTELCDHLKLLWPQLARLHCRGCGRAVEPEPPARVWAAVREGHGADAAGRDVLITFDLPLSAKLGWAESLALVARQGYQRLWLEGAVVRLEDAARGAAPRGVRAVLTVVQDRVRLTDAHRARFVEACEQAYRFGHGKLAVHELAPEGRTRGVPRPFSSRRHCAACELEYGAPTAALFSYNHPLGACPACRGFGRTITIDYALAVPDRSKTLAGGAVKPWQSGLSAECQRDLMKFCRATEVPTDVPFERLSPRDQEWILYGDPEYGKDPEHEWPRAWYGVKGYFRWLESKAYKMHVRVLLSRYRSYQPCPACQGRRLQPEALLYRVPAEALPPGVSGTQGLTLADFYALPIRDAQAVVEHWHRARARTRDGHGDGGRKGGGASDPMQFVLEEIRARLGYLVEIGLGYLTLDRPTRTLSGGETERVNLTTCLGTRLVNTLFVLDEPSVGLHPRDTARLVRIVEHLRDAGNTVVVVEHEPEVMRAADQIVDLGPGHGETGGQVVFQGTYRDLLRSKPSLTGAYLSGRARIEVPTRRPVDLEAGPRLRLSGARRHNLKDLTVDLPLGRLVCVTGVSGSGKSTLMRDVLWPAVEARVQRAASGSRPAEGAEAEGDAAAATSGPEREEEREEEPEARASSAGVLTGWESLRRVVLVDQAPLGKTPRSNPAVYIGAFDDLRELFAQSEAAKQRGLNASAFSFNSAQGQCERCRGAGFEKIEMQFLSDVFISCPDCQGRRYRPHLLEVRLASEPAAPPARGPGRARATMAPAPGTPARAWSIADVLEATVEDVRGFLAGFPDAKPARRAREALRWLEDVGLGYLRLGQPINTLSGGESQRLKLVGFLAEAARVERGPAGATQATEASGPAATLFLFDEPTTGLHFDDVRVLLAVFQRLVDAGHSVAVIEHNLEVIKCADWVIDLGPEAGDAGGRVVAVGPPETIAACAASHTGQALRQLGVGPGAGAGAGRTARRASRSIPGNR